MVGHEDKVKTTTMKPPPTRPPRHHHDDAHQLPPNKRLKYKTNNPSKGGNEVVFPDKILPVTLLSGFLGAGKTTLLKRILESKNSEMKIAIIVNDMGAINLDAREIRQHKLIQEKQEMIEMHNGCICCTLRGDLLRTVKALAMENKYDYLVIESTGISEPLPVAQTFAMDANGGDDDVGDDHDGNLGQVGEQKQPTFEPLSKYARMDTLVTVLDAYNFAPILGSIEQESDREKFFGTSDVEAMTDESDETIAKLLMDQIEFANVILLNKIDLLFSGGDSGRSNEYDGVIGRVRARSQIRAIRALVSRLNPDATLIIPDEPKFQRFDVGRIINTGLFDMEKAQESAGWITELEKPYHTPETEEYGIGSFVFRNNERPFHPERLARIMKNFGTGLLTEITGTKVNNSDKASGQEDIEVFSHVVRCKGEMWLSNADSCPIGVHSVGRQLVMTPGKPWMGKVHEVYPFGDPNSVKSREEDCEMWSMFDLTNDVIEDFRASNRWTARFRDRGSELVFIGIKLDKKLMLKELHNALLTDAELNVPEDDRKKAWASDMTDHFFDGMPLWELEDILGEGSEDVCDAEESDE